MSKAFTKEDSEVDDDATGDEPVHRGSNYITRAGFERMQNELSQLWHGERPRVTREVQEAAAQGDRSENAEYIYGKKRLREIDRRIRFLSKRLDALTVVEPSSEQHGRVYFGAVVTVEDEDGRRSTYRIVGPDEWDLTRGEISIDSPVAKALLGKKVDDVVTVVRPKGQVEVTLTAVTYPPLTP
jgi:transcription elongation factor GreB